MTKGLENSTTRNKNANNFLFRSNLKDILWTKKDSDTIIFTYLNALLHFTTNGLKGLKIVVHGLKRRKKFIF